MTDKAYIVANEEQEHEVLEQFENQGYIWFGGGEKPTEWTPTSKVAFVAFPYALLDGGELGWCYIHQLDNEEIVFDGRKEERMSEKYVVSREFMNDLNEWKEAYITDTLDEKYHYVSAGDLDTLPGMIKDWWIELNKPTETNNRLIAIIRWVNGEDVFEVEKPKKWVVRSKETDDDNDHWYVRLPNNIDVINDVVYYMSSATLFNTKEEAQSWANSHQEVVQVEVGE